jgi:hypothetical protein
MTEVVTCLVRAFDRELKANGMVMLERTDQVGRCSNKAWNAGTVTGI